MTDLQAEVERLRQENEALKALKAKPGVLTFRVSDKGALSVYGLGRFPVTLYREQWEKLLERSEALSQFIADNQEYLVIKAGVVRESTPPAPVASVPPKPPAIETADDDSPY